ADTPAVNTSPSENTVHMTNIDVVTAAVASTPSPRTHSASTHWYATRSRCDASTGSASRNSSRGIGPVTPRGGAAVFMRRGSARERHVLVQQRTDLLDLVRLDLAIQRVGVRRRPPVVDRHLHAALVAREAVEAAPRRVLPDRDRAYAQVVRVARADRLEPEQR